MKQTNNTLTFLMAQYRAIFKNAYFKGLTSALVVTAGLAAAQGANADVNFDASKWSGTDVTSPVIITGDSAADGTESKYQHLTLSGSSTTDKEFTINIQSGSTTQNKVVNGNSSATTITGKNVTINLSGADANTGLSISGATSSGASLTIKAFNITTGTLQLSGASKGIATLTADTITLNGAKAADAVLNFSGSASVVANNTLTINNGTIATDTATDNKITAKTADLTNATVTVAASSDLDLSAATLNLNSGTTITNSGAMVLGKAGAGNSVNLSGASITHTSSDRTGQLFSAADFNMTGGTLTINGGKFFGNSEKNDDAWTGPVDNDFTATGGVINASQSEVVFANMTLGGDVKVTVGGQLKGTSVNTLVNNTYFGTAGEEETKQGTLTIQGNATVTLNAASLLAATTLDVKGGKIVLNGEAAEATNPSGSAVIRAFRVPQQQQRSTINLNGGELEVQGYGDIRASDINLNGSAINVGANSTLTIAGYVKNNFSASSGDLTTRANFNMTGGSINNKGTLTLGLAANPEEELDGTKDSQFTFAGGTFVNDKEVIVQGKDAGKTTFTLAGTKLTNNGDLIIKDKAVFETSGSGDIVLNGTGTLKLESGATATLGGDNVVLNGKITAANGSTVNINGQVDISGVTNKDTVAKDTAFTINAGGVLKADSLNNVASSYINSGTTNGLSVQSGGVLEVGNLNLKDASAVSTAGTVRVTGSLGGSNGATFGAGTLQLGKDDGTTAKGTVTADLTLNAGNTTNVFGTWASDKKITVNATDAANKATLNVGSGDTTGNLTFGAIKANSNASINVNSGSSITVNGVTPDSGDTTASGTAGYYGFDLADAKITINGGTFIIGETAASAMLNAGFYHAEGEEVDKDQAALNAAQEYVYNNFGNSSYILSNAGKLQINFADGMKFTLEQFKQMKKELFGSETITGGSLALGGASISNLDDLIQSGSGEDAGSSSLGFADYEQQREQFAGIDDAYTDVQLTDVNGTVSDAHFGSIELAENGEVNFSGVSSLNNADNSGNLVANADGSTGNANLKTNSTLTLRTEGDIADVTLESGSGSGFTTLNANNANTLNSVKAVDKDGVILDNTRFVVSSQAQEGTDATADVAVTKDVVVSEVANKGGNLSVGEGIRTNTMTNAGDITVANNGVTVAGTLSNNESASLTLDKGNIDVATGNLNNDGDISVATGDIKVDKGNLSNGGSLSITTGEVQVAQGALNNTGSLAVTNGNVSVGNGALKNEGALEVSSGDLVVAKGMTTTSASTTTAETVKITGGHEAGATASVLAGNMKVTEVNTATDVSNTTDPSLALDNKDKAGFYLDSTQQDHNGKLLQAQISGTVDAAQTTAYLANTAVTADGTLQARTALLGDQVDVGGTLLAERTIIGSATYDDTTKERTTSASEVSISGKADLGEVTFINGAADKSKLRVTGGDVTTTDVFGDAGALIAVGSDKTANQESTTGSLEITGVLHQNGSAIVVDPAYGEKTALVAIRSLEDYDNSQTHPDVGVFQGDVFVGQNSALGVGVNANTLRSLIAQFQDNGSFKNPADNEDAYGSVLYLDGQTRITKDHGITLTADSMASVQKLLGLGSGYAKANTIYLGSNTALAINTNKAWNDGTAYIRFVDTDTGGNEVSATDSTVIANGGEILLYGNKFHRTYQIFEDDVTITGLKDTAGTIEVSSANGLLEGVITDESDGQVVLSINRDKAKIILNGASAPVQETLLSYVKGYNGEFDDDLSDGDDTDYLFVYDKDGNKITINENERLINNDFLSQVILGGNGADAEKVARAGIYGGAAQAALAAGATTYEAVSGRMGVGANGANLTVADNTQGSALWLSPIYKNNESDGFGSQGVNYGVDLDLFGLALGADYTMPNGVRFGAAFNVGSGDADGDGAGSGVSNDFNYYGFSVYGGYAAGPWSIIADLSYTSVDNDVDIDTTQGKSNTSFDSSNLSLGVTGSYQTDVEGVSVTPHAGLRFTQIDLDDYEVKNGNETVARYEADSMSIFSIPVGITVSKEFVNGTWTVKPSFDLTLTCNFGDDEMEGTTHWAGIENLATAVSSEVLDNFTYGATVGVAAKSGNFSLGFSLNYTGSSNTDEFGVNANARFVF